MKWFWVVNVSFALVCILAAMFIPKDAAVLCAVANVNTLLAFILFSITQQNADIAREIAERKLQLLRRIKFQQSNA